MITAITIFLTMFIHGAVTFFVAGVHDDNPEAPTICSVLLGAVGLVGSVSVALVYYGMQLGAAQ